MPTGKIKNPALFPPLYTALLSRIPELGFEILLQSREERKCHTEAKRWRAFIKSFELYPSAEGWREVEAAHFRTRIAASPWSPNYWQLKIYRKRKLGIADFQFQELSEEEKDSLYPELLEFKGEATAAKRDWRKDFEG